MNKVITINLHGRAYQVEEGAYEKLEAYLDEAKAKLATDPDSDEIISDLEQAIADKLERFLKSGKNVVIEKEADEVIGEMGPVEADGQSEDGEAKEESSKSSLGAKRLYRIREGAMIKGVCTGLAAYFGLDVTLVRIVFIVLALLTHGFWIIVYIILMVAMPKAATSAEKAAAYGEPFTAQEWIDRARDEFSDKGEWKKWKHEFKEKLRQEKREWREYRRAKRRSIRGGALSVLLLIFISLFWLAGFFTIFQGNIFGIGIPAGIPVWIALLAWICIYSFVTWPIRFNLTERLTRYEDEHNHWRYHRHGFLESLAWMAFIIIIIWALWQYIPESHVYFFKAKDWLNNFAAAHNLK